MIFAAKQKIDSFSFSLYLSNSMHRSYWKQIFSKEVLGQTDLLFNPASEEGSWSHRQSYPWLATVLTFESKCPQYWRPLFMGIPADNLSDGYGSYQEDDDDNYYDYDGDYYGDRCRECGEGGVVHSRDHSSLFS